MDPQCAYVKDVHNYYSSGPGVEAWSDMGPITMVAGELRALIASRDKHELSIVI